MIDSARHRVTRNGEEIALLPKACAVIIDEAHKLPEASRQMFGKTRTAEDIQSIIKALRSEKFLLAAENLSGVSTNLINTMAKPPEDKPFSEYVRLLIAPERTLAVAQKKLYPELSAPARRRLRDTSAAAATLCGEKDDMIRYATETEKGETMLCATVSNLSEKLGHTMWEQPRPFLLTSGTLAVGRDFRRFRQEAGLNNLKGVGGLSPKTLTNMRNMMHLAFAQAVQNRLIRDNIIEGVRLPRTEKKEMRVLNREEQDKLVTAAKCSEEPAAFGIVFDLFTGIRIGELCGLRWKNVRLDEKEFRICETRNRLPNHDDSIEKLGGLYGTASPKYAPHR